MVRRLVEEEHVGLPGECAAKRRARQLPAGEGVEPALEVGVAEAETAEDARRAVAPAVPTRMLEPGLRLPVPTEGLRCVIPARHRLLESAQLSLRGDEIRGARKGVLAQRLAAEARRALVVQRDARPLLPGELPSLELGLAHQRPQQRRLARPVRAGEGKPVASLHLEGDAVEEGVA